MTTGWQAVMFPSLGFFGGTNVDSLRVPLDQPVSRILLRVPPEVRTTLDLRGVELWNGDEMVAVSALAVHVRQSSHRSDRDHEGDPFQQQRIVTATEQGPWWLARFPEPLMAERLHVLNRKDRLGHRVRRLIVQAAPPRQPWRTVAEVGGVEDCLTATRLVSALTGVELDQAALGKSPGQMRTTVLATLAARARERPLGRDLEEVRQLLSLIPTGSRRSRPELTTQEMVVLAHLLSAQFAWTGRTPTSVASFGFALSSRAHLERLRLGLDDVRHVFGLPPLVITRHGLRAESALRSAAPEYLALMERARADFRRLGMPLMLSYGTLLGAIREQDFLAHDDDIDLLFPIAASGREEARPAISAICAQLESLGWEVWRNVSVSALNFHLIDPLTRRRVDLFPVLLEGDTARLHMQGMRLEAIQRDVILPTRTLDFLGTTVDVPNRPEEFLLARYGDTWNVADPYDDWPWPLDRN